jgi:hypothetical protein
MVMIGSSLLRRSCKWCSNNREKVLLASHQLSGPAANWWDAYVEAHEEPESINWPEFRAAFHAHHILQGVIKLKKEF